MTPDMHDDYDGHVLRAPERARPIPTRRQALWALVVGAVMLGAALAQCVGQSFSRRQANALEGIEHKLDTMQLKSTPITAPIRPCTTEQPVDR